MSPEHDYETRVLSMHAYLSLSAVDFLLKTNDMSLGKGDESWGEMRRSGVKHVIIEEKNSDRYSLER